MAAVKVNIQDVGNVKHTFGFLIVLGSTDKILMKIE
jgi:hypothetical protein